MKQSQGKVSLAEVICQQITTFDPAGLDHVKTVLLDSIACIHAGGVDREILDGFGRALASDDDARTATEIACGRRVPLRAAILANGANLRARDLMDVYAGSDVTHPSEIVPTALALAEANGATGRDFLDALAVGLALHVALSRALPLHPLGLHHTGHAALVVPVVAARLAGCDSTTAATALNLTATGLFVPEGFSRGHVTNLKTFAYALQALRALQMLDLAAVGLTAGEHVIDEMTGLWERLGGSGATLAEIESGIDGRLVDAIWLKQFPAQYALQPLIASAIAMRAQHSLDHRQIEAVTVLASRRTVERCADPAKTAIGAAETADHSLPFCVAAALVDGRLDTASLEHRRWDDPAVSRVMARIEARPAAGGGLDYEVGPQAIEIRLTDGRTLKATCSYPEAGVTWRSIATEKLRRHAPDFIDADAVIACVDTLHEAASIESLAYLLRCRDE